MKASYLKYSLVLVLASLLANLPVSALRTYTIGDTLPELSLKTLDGHSVTRKELKGKAILMVYLRPGQSHSSDALKLAQTLAKEYISHDLKVIVVAPGEKGKEYLGKIAKLSPPTLIHTVDAKRQTAADLGIMVTPTTLVISNDFKLQFQLPQISPAYERNLRLHIKRILGMISKAEHQKVLNLISANQETENNHFFSNVMLARELIIYNHPAKALKAINELLKEPYDQADFLNALKCLALINLNRPADAKLLMISLKGKRLEHQMVAVRMALQEKSVANAELLIKALPITSSEDKRIVKGLGRIRDSRSLNKRMLKRYQQAIQAVVGSSN